MELIGRGRELGALEGWLTSALDGSASGPVLGGTRSGEDPAGAGSWWNSRRRGTCRRRGVGPQRWRAHRLSGRGLRFCERCRESWKVPRHLLAWAWPPIWLCSCRGCPRWPSAIQRRTPRRWPVSGCSTRLVASCRHLRLRQSRGPLRVAGAFDELERVGVGELEAPGRERVEHPGEVLPQHLPQPLQVPGPFPDQRLMRAGGQLRRVSLVAVPGDRAVTGSVETDDLGQHVRVAGVGFRPRGRVPLPIPRHRERVDR
ncbi:MAG: hypothetical protein QOE59_832 [Actinomycetota bacterium]|nr:hypothetical protein [Actinomycetota bacterium]